MNASKPNITMSEFIFRKPAIYKIEVQGVLGENLSERLGGMQICVNQSPDKKMISLLIGQISDQAALSGVLNTLYESQLSNISVNLLKDT